MKAVQLNLFEDDVPLRAANDNESDMQAKFEEYHRENPHVYELVRDYAYKAIKAGHSHYGIQSIFELIRWHTTVETTGDAFKINNNYGSRYARMFNDEHPQYGGFFFTRQQKGAANEG